MKQAGFSLVEILIFTTIVALFFVLGAAVMIFSLRQMQVAQHRIVATREAESLISWFKSAKEVNWGGAECSGCAAGTSAFTEQVSRVTHNLVYPTICFNTLDWLADDVCSPSDYSLDGLYKREAKFTYAVVSGYISQVTVAVTVYWRESGESYQVTSNTVLSVWE
ncbi:type II secretion system GspH family protein [Patescibacteria group bacterium]|nr:type II secretion system GspH family protein [Patescibacteria group bacterium]MCL5091865.1 type II secretion system GspH family protein [Patescibacteria group bacterium]